MDQPPRSNTTNTAFDGKRLRKLQLERTLSSIPDGTETSQGDPFRRWSSLNESGFQDGVSSGPLTSANSTPIGASYPSSSRPKFPNEPVVYVLPDLKKGTERDLLSQGASSKYRGKLDSGEEEKWDLKYPHGMPRWGPRLVTPSKSSFEKYPTEENLPGGRQQTIYQNAKKDETNSYEDHMSATSVNWEVSSSKKTKKDRQQAVVEKAKAQSMLAAARAVQNIAAVSPGSLSKLVPKRMVEGSQALGSRLLGLGPKKSLLQSARIKQAHVMQTNIRQAHSLDDPLRQKQQQKNVSKQEHITSQSVKSFEFLKGQSTTRPAHAQTVVQVETVESSSDDGGNESVSIDDSSSADVSEIDPQLAADNDSHSWSMGSSGVDVELSIDETIDDSAGIDSAVEKEDEAEEGEDQEFDHAFSTQPRTPQSTSIPAMIVSEVSSRHSDYSSLELRGSKEYPAVPAKEESDKFFDAIESFQFLRDRSFDAKRCRELLEIRNRYMEDEERRKILSPQAESRLATTPSLLRTADEKALLELATRSKWIERTLAYQKLPPAEPVISSPFSAAYPRRYAGHEPALASMPYDGPAIEPIALVARSALTQPTITRKEPWHVTNLNSTKGAGVNAMAATREGSECSHFCRTVSFKVKLRRFFLWLLYFILFLLWATRSCRLLQASFTMQGVNLMDADGTQQDDDPKSADAFREDSALSNVSNVQLRPGTTRFEWTDMPIILLDLSRVYDDMFSVRNEEARRPSPQKCAANFTKIFWNDLHFIREMNNREEALISVAEEQTTPVTEDSPNIKARDWFLVDMLPDQTFCDDEFRECYGASSLPYFDLQPRHEEPVLDIGSFGLSLEDNNKKKPLLKSLGDILRKGGQQLQAHRKMRRERYIV